MSPLYTALLVAHVFIAFVLTFFVLIQKTTGGGLFTSSQTNPFISGADMTSFIVKLTVAFITLFFINTIVLAKLSYNMNVEKSGIILQSTDTLLKEDLQEKTTDIPITE